MDSNNVIQFGPARPREGSVQRLPRSLPARIYPIRPTTYEQRLRDDRPDLYGAFIEDEPVRGEAIWLAVGASAALWVALFYIAGRAFG